MMTHDNALVFWQELCGRLQLQLQAAQRELHFFATAVKDADNMDDVRLAVQMHADGVYAEDEDEIYCDDDVVD